MNQRKSTGQRLSKKTPVKGVRGPRGDKNSTGRQSQLTLTLEHLGDWATNLTVWVCTDWTQASLHMCSKCADWSSCGSVWGKLSRKLLPVSGICSPSWAVFSGLGEEALGFSETWRRRGREILGAPTCSEKNRRGNGGRIMGGVTLKRGVCWM